MESGLDPAGFKLRSGLSRLVICSLLKRSDSHGPAPRYHVDSGSHFCAIALKPSFSFVFGGCLEQTTLEAAKRRSRAVNAEADGSGSLSFFPWGVCLL